MEEGFSGKRTAEIVGITYRQLDYWARTDLIRPTVADAKGSGTRRKYAYRDLLELKMVKNLLEAGIRLELVRSVFENMRSHVGDITSANLVITGSQAVLVSDDGELIDLLKRGQGVLNVLSLDGVRSEVDAAILELRPPPAGAGADQAVSGGT